MQFKRYALLAGLLGLVLLALYLFMRIRYGKPSVATAPVTVLPKEDKEQILIDPVKHTLIIVKPTGNETLTLPDHPSTVDIRKDGTVKITSPQWGLERRFFFGAQGSSAFRLAAGLDGAYFKKLDVGIGVANAIGAKTPIVFGKLSYNFYDNMQIGITYGTDRLIGGAITVRL